MQELKTTFTSISGKVLHPTVDSSRRGQLDKFGHPIWGDEDVENFIEYDEVPVFKSTMPLELKSNSDFALWLEDKKNEKE